MKFNDLVSKILKEVIQEVKGNRNSVISSIKNNLIPM
ncbi:hypothetical protein CDFC105_73133 [Clostridioides difficile]|nr:hypothetical protein CDFC105_60642 [Clostridioides difficile]CZR95926.1 hypothetical protein CDFC105_60715 [Clostridioides difficile]CZS09247.1 hypothetical protein CDFC105_73060 [Clostridioides difficile]CZS09436.1 hypothetical protein CDFC105_73133 [Clostridioides difficile]